MRKEMWVIGVLAVMLLLACTKDEGPSIQERVIGTWQLNSYLRNDVDETNSIQIADYQETYSSQGIYSRSYIDGSSQEVLENGKYLVDEADGTIHLSDISSIDDFSESHSTLSSSTVIVLQLDGGSYSYSFENGGDKHTFVFGKVMPAQ